MEKETPLISVISPVYKVEEYLHRCIDSVLNQTYGNIELVLVNDGSPDKCGDICDEYAEKNIGRIKVLHKGNGGPSSARNAGIDVSSGKYLFFIDSDDYITKDCIEKLYDSITEYQSDCAVTALLHVYPKSGAEQVKYNLSGQYGVMSRAEAINTMLYGGKFDVSMCGKLFKRELFGEIRFPIGRYHEDASIIYKIFFLCNRVSHVKEPMYRYERRDDGSRTAYLGQKKIDDIIEITDEMRYFIQKNIPECNSAAIYHMVKNQFALCLKMQLGDKNLIGQYRHMKANIIKNRAPVIGDERANLRVKLCCLLSYLGFPLLRLAWKIYRGTLRGKF